MFYFKLDKNILSIIFLDFSINYERINKMKKKLNFKKILLQRSQKK